MSKLTKRQAVKVLAENRKAIEEAFTHTDDSSFDDFRQTIKTSDAVCAAIDCLTGKRELQHA